MASPGDSAWSWAGSRPWDAALAPAQPRGSRAGCSPSSPAARGAAARVAPRNVLLAPGRQFSGSCSWASEKQAGETSGFGLPFPTGCRTTMPSHAVPCCLAPAPQHLDTLAPWPLFHLIALSPAVQRGKGSIPGAGQGHPFSHHTHRQRSPTCQGAGLVPAQHPSTPPGTKAGGSRQPQGRTLHPTPERARGCTNPPSPKHPRAKAGGRRRWRGRG